MADEEVYEFWCKNIRWSAAEFAALYCGLNPYTWVEVQSRSPKYTLDTNTKQAIEDVLALIESRLDPLSTVNSPQQWGELLSMLDLPPRDWMTRIIEPQPSGPADSSGDPHRKEEKPLGKRERDTLLTIIAALCDYSGLNYRDRGASVRIAQMTEDIGAPVSDDAIRGWLQKIPDAVQTRTK